MLQFSSNDTPVEWKGIRLAVAGWSYLRDNENEAPMGLGAFSENAIRVSTGRIALASNASGLSGDFRVRYGGFYATDTSHCAHQTVNLVCMPIHYVKPDKVLQLRCAINIIDSNMANLDTQLPPQE